MEEKQKQTEGLEKYKRLIEVKKTERQIKNVARFNRRYKGEKGKYEISAPT